MLFTKIILFSLIMMISQSAIAEIVVIANKDNTAKISKHDIQLLYLGKTETFSNGSKAIVFNLKEGNIKDIFNESILNRSTSQLSAYWSRLIFTGKAVPPDIYKDEAAIISAVNENTHAIAYVSAETAATLSEKIRIITFNN